MLVPVGEPGPDVALEGLDGAVDAAVELLLREFGEPPLDPFSQDALVGVKCRCTRGWAGTHQGLLRRIKVQTDDVTDLVDEQRIFTDGTFGPGLLGAATRTPTEPGT